jgi:DNA repair photolyase
MSVPVDLQPVAPHHALVERLPECGVWAISPYERCSFRCSYCITGVQGTSAARLERDELLAQLQSELSEIPTDERLALGALCDAYPPIEATAGLTRAVLTELQVQRRPVSIITKGLTVLRDIDLLAADPVTQVTISLSSLDAATLATLDPGAPSPAARLEAVAALVAANVPTSVTVTPWIPGVSDVAAIATAARAAAGRNIWIQAGPLNVVAPVIAMSRFAGRWDQASINAAYVRARDETSGLEPISWWPPVPLDGASHSRRFA